MLRDIDERLWRWGDYMRERADAGLGYPRATTIHRCMTEGPGAGQSGGHGGDVIPEAVAETEAAIQRLPVPLKQAVKAKYLRREHNRQAAKRLGISVGTYRQRIDQAQHFVAGTLQGAAA